MHLPKRITTLSPSFTLIELIVVIAILAVLVTAVIVVLNPVQLLQNTRDAKRLADMAGLRKAVDYASIYNSISLGSSSVLYISIPDSAATTTQGDQCQGLSMPSLPSNWQYHCAASSTYQLINGTGWIPINFTSTILGGPPISNLPVDPTNSTSTGEYYTYAVSGDPQYELTAIMESTKYTSQQAYTGGPDPGQYEVGTDLNISPFAHGLVGYWKFDDASGGKGSTTVDSSGYGNNGTLSDATSTGTGPTYQSTGCVKGGCLSFDGSDDWVEVGNQSSLNLSTYSFTAWINPTVIWAVRGILGKYNSTFPAYYNYLDTNICADPPQGPLNLCDPTTISTGAWTFVAVVIDDSSLQMKTYINGSLTSSLSLSTQAGTYTNSNNFEIGNIGAGSSNLDVFWGLLDNIRIYNRALSAAEIQAIYNTRE